VVSSSRGKSIFTDCPLKAEMESIKDIHLNALEATAQATLPLRWRVIRDRRGRRLGKLGCAIFDQGSALPQTNPPRESSEDFLNLCTNIKRA
jgi:hypothetical protein